MISWNSGFVSLLFCSGNTNIKVKKRSDIQIVLLGGTAVNCETLQTRHTEREERRGIRKNITSSKKKNQCEDVACAYVGYKDFS
jgi:short subunit dehydrogenase-like uncharacterized protein